MGVWRTKLVLALDAGSVQAARLLPGLGGPRYGAVSRRPLASGALVPAALKPNVRRPEELREAIRNAVAEAGGAGVPAIVVLPDAVARTLLLEVPGGTDPREYARFRLASQLPYPVADAVVDVTTLRGRRAIAAAVRREVAAEYEQLASECGLAQERLDLASLAAVAWLSRDSGGPRVDVILGEAAFSLALMSGGTAVAFRTRRRDPGPDEAERLALEIERTVQMGATPGETRIRVVGPGARHLAEAWGAKGLSARSGWGGDGRVAFRDAEEIPWLGAGLA
jgi:hypothetical protein